MIFKRDKDSLKSSTTQKSVESLRQFIEYYQKEDKTLSELINLCDIVYNKGKLDQIYQYYFHQFYEKLNKINFLKTNKGNILKKPKCKWQDILIDQLNSLKEAYFDSNEWIDKIISQLNDSSDFESNKNWETEFYGINYCNIVDKNHQDLIKEYVNHEVEYDAGPIFRSHEKEPESLRMFISSTVESLNNLIPKVVERNPFEQHFKKHKRMCESFVSDLTKYYTSEEIIEDNGFMSKLKIIKENLKLPENPLSKFIQIFESEFWNWNSKTLCTKASSETGDVELYSPEIEFAVEQAITDIKNMIFIVCITIIRMYKLQLINNDLDQDLIHNLIISLLLQK